jgi:hypothetical protein
MESGSGESTRFLIALLFVGGRLWGRGREVAAEPAAG